MRSNNAEFKILHCSLVLEFNRDIFNLKVFEAKIFGVSVTAIPKNVHYVHQLFFFFCYQGIDESLKNEFPGNMRNAVQLSQSYKVKMHVLNSIQVH